MICIYRIGETVYLHTQKKYGTIEDIHFTNRDIIFQIRYDEIYTKEAFKATHTFASWHHISSKKEVE
jgi:hypothetical protein